VKAKDLPVQLNFKQPEWFGQDAEHHRHMTAFLRLNLGLSCGCFDVNNRYGVALGFDGDTCCPDCECVSGSRQSGWLS